MGAPRRSTTRTRARLAVLVVALVAPLAAGGQAGAASGADPSAVRSKAAWDRDTGTAARKRPGKQALVSPRRYAAFSLDPAALEDVLADAPRERTVAARKTPLVVSVPAPDGGFERFALTQSPVMAPTLAAQHPEIRTYAGRGVDDPTATVRLDLTPLGFHGAVRAARGSWFVDPRYRDQTQYVAYARDAVTADPAQEFVEREGAVGDLPAVRTGARTGEAAGAAVSLRTYRLALVSDPTYASAPAVGGLVTAAKVTLMNRVNQLYEADFAIRLQLIAGNDALNLNTNALATGADGPCGASPCFTPTELSACDVPTLNRMDIVAGLLAGARNFDIGHIILGTDGGGIANLGVVGDDHKASGCTGLTTPVGDAFAVDYVAHEMGHQFGGDHTFNGTQVNCSGGNRAPGTSVEPGSGTTVMAYAGICGTDDTQPHSDPYFSQASITQMSAYVLSTGAPSQSIQQAALTGFGGVDSFKLTVDGTPTTAITRGTTYTPAGIKTALETAGSGTVTVTNDADGNPLTLADSGFTVTFVAAGVAKVIGITEVTGATGYVNDTQAGGPTRRGGTAVTGPNHAPSVSTTPSFTIPARLRSG